VADQPLIFEPGTRYLYDNPAELNRFARAYAGAKFSRDVQTQQLQLVRGTSEPPGPGRNRAGLGIFRYDTRCGMVFGHTGNSPGYTAFFASNHRRLAVARSIGDRTAQREPRGPATPGLACPARVEEDAVCAALA
jgi:D-alanyl-D-alanine carboxypeptidase